MKLNLVLCFILAFLAVSLSSCETMFDNIFDRHADYNYLIQNNSSATIQVEVEARPQPNVIIKGNARWVYTIAPGSTQEVWTTSGFAEDKVYDEEKDNDELYWFKVNSAVKDGLSARKYLNDTGWWVYKKEKDYKATYTYTLTDSDF